MNILNTLQQSFGASRARTFVASVFAAFVGFALFGAFSAPGQTLQSVPTPASAQTKPIYLVGGTLHTGNGAVLENATIGFDKGKITFIGKADAQFDRSNAEVLDVAGKHVYPGFIAASANLGLVEIESVRATNDQSETGGINPHARALVAYNAESHITPTVRANGVLLALVAPQGGLVSGRSSLVELDGWNWEDAAVKADVGVHVNWPSMTRRAAATEAEIKTQDEAIAKQIASLYQLFREAQAYAKSPAPKEKNLRFEAMRGLFNGSSKLFLRANEAKSILAAVNFAKDFALTPVLVGGADAWMLADMLKAANVAVIVEETHRLPMRPGDDVDQPYKTPALLAKAGVLCCLAAGGGWQQRNLPFQAGTTAGYGLSKEEALALIAANAAKILGVGDRLGTLELGKDATLFVSDGDALDMRTNNVQRAFIRGKKLQLVNKQTFLYEQYKAKYGK